MAPKPDAVEVYDDKGNLHAKAIELSDTRALCMLAVMGKWYMGALMILLHEDRERNCPDQTTTTHHSTASGCTTECR